MVRAHSDGWEVVCLNSTLGSIGIAVEDIIELVGILDMHALIGQNLLVRLVQATIYLYAARWRRI